MRDLKHGAYAERRSVAYQAPVDATPPSAHMIDVPYLGPGPWASERRTHVAMLVDRLRLALRLTMEPSTREAPMSCANAPQSLMSHPAQLPIVYPFRLSL